MKTKTKIFLFFLLVTNLSIAQNVSFSAVGDILLDRGIRRTINKHGVNYPFSAVKRILYPSDLTFGNLECPIAIINPIYKIKKIYSFRADTQFINALKIANFNILSVANNHSFDYSQYGFIQTVQFLKQYNITPVGYGTKTTMFKPIIIKNKKIKFAFFAYADFYLPTSRFDNTKLFAANKQCKIKKLLDSVKKYNKLVDFVIVSIHWGIEDSHKPNNEQKNLAHKLIENGADLIIGHHPHVLQSIEIYQDKIILYSLGNFLFDNPRLPQRQTVIFKCNFNKQTITDPYIVPVYIESYKPRAVNANKAKEIFNLINKYSINFNTKLIFKDSIIKIDYNMPQSNFELIINDLRFVFTKKKIINYYGKHKIFIELKDKNKNFKLAGYHLSSNLLYLYFLIYSKNNKQYPSLTLYDIKKHKFISTQAEKINFKLLKTKSEIYVNIYQSKYKENQYFIYLPISVFIFKQYSAEFYNSYAIIVEKTKKKTTIFKSREILRELTQNLQKFKSIT